MLVGCEEGVGEERGMAAKENNKKDPQVGADGRFINAHLEAHYHVGTEKRDTRTKTYKSNKHLVRVPLVHGVNRWCLHGCLCVCLCVCLTQ